MNSIEARVAAAKALPEAANMQIVADQMARSGKSLAEISTYLKGCIAVGNTARRDDAPWRKNQTQGTASSPATICGLWDEVIAQINSGTKR